MMNGDYAGIVIEEIGRIAEADVREHNIVW